MKVISIHSQEYNICVGFYMECYKRAVIHSEVKRIEFRFLPFRQITGYQGSNCEVRSL